MGVQSTGSRRQAFRKRSFIPDILVRAKRVAHLVVDGVCLANAHTFLADRTDAAVQAALRLGHRHLLGVTAVDLQERVFPLGGRRGRHVRSRHAAAIGPGRGVGKVLVAQHQIRVVGSHELVDVIDFAAAATDTRERVEQTHSVSKINIHRGS